MTERRAVPVSRLAETDALLEAFIELARSAIATDREADERRAKMALVERPRRGGRAA